MKENRGTQSSWDWDADYRFAEYVGDPEIVALIKKEGRSMAPGPLLWMHHEAAFGKIHKRRLRALRYLKKIGLLERWYSGCYLWGDLIRTSEYRILGYSDWD